VPLFGRTRSQCRVGYAIPLFVAQLVSLARVSVSVAFSCAVCLLLNYLWCNRNKRASIRDSPDTCHKRHREIMMPAGTIPDKCGPGQPHDLVPSTGSIAISNCGDRLWPAVGTRGRHKAVHLNRQKKAVPGGSSSGNGGDAKREANVAPVERLLYGRKEAAFALSISVREVDYGLSFGEFETRRVGRRVLITASSLKRWASINHYRPASKRKPARPEQEDRAA